MGVAMRYMLDNAAKSRLDDYFAQIGTHLRRKEQRASFATYAFGILGEEERKSVELTPPSVRGEAQGYALRVAA